LRIQAREEAMATKIGSPEVALLEAGAVEVRLLCGADATAFQALRLEALARHPSAFASAYHEEADQPLAEVALRLDQGPVFGAFANGALAGTAGLAVPARAKKRHKGELWGVYVREEDRGQGLGRRLVEAAIAHARGHLEQLHATVTTGNHAARQLYRSLGFQTYGREPRGLKVSAAYFDQELLVLLLRR
jgi:ribosomal protein S18 acetylase RimI-like enzyme